MAHQRSYPVVIRSLPEKDFQEKKDLAIFVNNILKSAKHPPYANGEEHMFETDQHPSGTDGSRTRSHSEPPKSAHARKTDGILPTDRVKGLYVPLPCTLIRSGDKPPWREDVTDPDVEDLTSHMSQMSLVSLSGTKFAKCDAVVDFVYRDDAQTFGKSCELQFKNQVDLLSPMFEKVEAELFPEFEQMFANMESTGICALIHKKSGVTVQPSSKSVKFIGEEWQIDIAKYFFHTLQQGLFKTLEHTDDVADPLKNKNQKLCRNVSRKTYVVTNQACQNMRQKGEENPKFLRQISQDGKTGKIREHGVDIAQETGIALNMLNGDETDELGSKLELQQDGQAVRDGLSGLNTSRTRSIGSETQLSELGYEGIDDQDASRILSLESSSNQIGANSENNRNANVRPSKAETQEPDSAWSYRVYISQDSWLYLGNQKERFKQQTRVIRKEFDIDIQGKWKDEYLTLTGKNRQDLSKAVRMFKSYIEETSSSSKQIGAECEDNRNAKARPSKAETQELDLSRATKVFISHDSWQYLSDQKESFLEQINYFEKEFNISIEGKWKDEYITLKGKHRQDLTKAARMITNCIDEICHRYDEETHMNRIDEDSHVTATNESTVLDELQVEKQNLYTSTTGSRNMRDMQKADKWSSELGHEGIQDQDDSRILQSSSKQIGAECENNRNAKARSSKAETQELDSSRATKVFISHDSWQYLSDQKESFLEQINYFEKEFNISIEGKWKDEYITLKGKHRQDLTIAARMITNCIDEICHRYDEETHMNRMDEDSHVTATNESTVLDKLQAEEQNLHTSRSGSTYLRDVKTEKQPSELGYEGIQDQDDSRILEKKKSSSNQNSAESEQNRNAKAGSLESDFEKKHKGTSGHTYLNEKQPSGAPNQHEQGQTYPLNSNGGARSKKDVSTSQTTNAASQVLPYSSTISMKFGVWMYMNTKEKTFTKRLESMTTGRSVTIDENRETDEVCISGTNKTDVEKVKNMIADHYCGFDFNLVEKPLKMSADSVMHDVDILQNRFTKVVFISRKDGTVYVCGSEDDVNSCLEDVQAGKIKRVATKQLLNDHGDSHYREPSPSDHKNKKIKWPAETESTGNTREPDEIRRSGEYHQIPADIDEFVDTLLVPPIIYSFLNKFFGDRINELRLSCSIEDITDNSEAEMAKICITSESAECGEQCARDLSKLVAQVCVQTINVRNEKEASFVKRLLERDMSCLVIFTPGGFQAACFVDEAEKLSEILEQARSNFASDRRERDFHVTKNTDAASLIEQIWEPFTATGFLLDDRVEIIIHKCDITKMSVDAIVNAANYNLDHGGGVAGVIAMKAGPTLQKDSDDYIRKNGFLKDSSVALTAAGDLPCRHVIHAVGPQWPKQNVAELKRTCIQLLQQTFCNVLRKAKSVQFTSIAIPPISSGIYRVPHDHVASAMSDAILKEAKTPSSLKVVHLVDISEGILQQVICNLRKERSMLNPGEIVEMDVERVKKTISAHSVSLPKGFTINKTMRVFIHKCDITLLDVEAIVNATTPTLDLSNGLSKTIANAAGPNMRKECKVYCKEKGPFPHGSIEVTSAEGRLACSVLFHAVVPYYPITRWPKSEDIQKQNSTIEILGMTMGNVLLQAKQTNIGTIAMPPLGSGISSFPKQVIAREFCRSLTASSWENVSLQEIHIVDVKDDVLLLIAKELQTCSCTTKIDDDQTQAVIAARIIAPSSASYASRNPTSLHRGSRQGKEPSRSSSSQRFTSDSKGHQATASSGKQTGAKPKSYAAAAAGNNKTRERDREKLQGGSGHGGEAQEKIIFSSNYRKHNKESSSASTEHNSQPKGKERKDETKSHSTSSIYPKLDQGRPSSIYPKLDQGRPTSGSSSSIGSKPRDKKDEIGDNCAICLSSMTRPKELQKCKHKFCEKCIDESFKKVGPKCPVCGMFYGKMTGTQPKGGSMRNITVTTHLQGYEGYQTIMITYWIPSGHQESIHPNPGRYYTGVDRTAYLPDNQEGREILRLLERAFAARLIFTIGKSSTTGLEGCVTWNDIHHKTSATGGPQNFGYPDPTYLKRVRDELAAKGIK